MRKRIPITQFEFSFGTDAFNLAVQTGPDTDRQAADMDKSEKDKAFAEKQQTTITTLTTNDTNT